MIDTKQKEGNWTFTFLGANQDSWAAGGAIAVSTNNIANFDMSNMQEAFSRVKVSTSRYLDSSQSRSSDFYGDSSGQ